MTVVDLPTRDPRALIPGAMQTELVRDIPTFGLIEFEEAPAGWLLSNGETRKVDWRAYHFTPPAASCDACGGVGRVEGKTVKGRKCDACRGTGNPSRRTRHTSPTTILDTILPKPGIPPWSEARGIEGTVEAIRRGLIDLDDPESVARAVEIVRANRLGADRAKDDAAERGLNVHGCLQVYMETGSPPNPSDHPAAHHGYLQGLSNFLLEHDPQPEAVEHLVANPDLGYCGRLDLVARCPRDGARDLWDAKTQTNGGIYPGAHLQTRLYRLAMIACGDGDVDRERIVVFAENGEFRVMDVDVSPELLDAALRYAELLKPLNSVCERINRVERDARKQAA